MRSIMPMKCIIKCPGQTASAPPARSGYVRNSSLFECVHCFYKQSPQTSFLSFYDIRWWSLRSGGDVKLSTHGSAAAIWYANVLVAISARCRLRPAESRQNIWAYVFWGFRQVYAQVFYFKLFWGPPNGKEDFQSMVFVLGATLREPSKDGYQY